VTVERRTLVLGAGFAGLELATLLSEALGAEAGVTLIDANDSFVFGYSKLDVMFGRTSVESVRLPYADIDKPGVEFRRERITAIDPEARTVTTDAGTHSAEHLVIALGAGYDPDATPGLVLERNEFYSVAGAEHLAGVVPEFREGHAVVGVCGAPYKCPPAPSEACLLLHDQLMRNGTRDRATITLISALPTPVPPSPETSEALLEAFAERGIEFHGDVRIAEVD
jgi:sulfide:quinone oxidoreductase